MNGVLKVDISKLTSTANSLKNTGSQIAKLTQNMTNTVNKLTGNVWSGDAASAYTKKFKGLQDDIERIKKMIDEHVNDLQEMARTYKKSEDESKVLANALSSDIIVYSVAGIVEERMGLPHEATRMRQPHCID